MPFPNFLFPPFRNLWRARRQPLPLSAQLQWCPLSPRLLLHLRWGLAREGACFAHSSGSSQHVLPIPLALVGRAGRARTGCGFLDPHHQSQELPICRACARSLTRDLGWPRLARSTLRRHCRCPVARPHVPASRLNHRYHLSPLQISSRVSTPFQMNLRVYRRSRV